MGNGRGEMDRNFIAAIVNLQLNKNKLICANVNAA